MDDVFEWTIPSRRELTHPPQGSTWVDPPSPGMMIVLMTDMMTEVMTEIIVSVVHVVCVCVFVFVCICAWMCVCMCSICVSLDLIVVVCVLFTGRSGPSNPYYDY